METEGKLVPNRIHVTLLIGRETERTARSFFPKSTERKVSSQTQTDAHRLCPPRSWTLMCSAPSTNCGKSYTNHRKWRLQMSAAKCYKA